LLAASLLSTLDNGPCYISAGYFDYARIEDFAAEDIIMLYGSASDYRLVPNLFGSEDWIFYTAGGSNDLVAIVQGSADARVNYVS
jgi:hypothetical protein